MSPSLTLSVLICILFGIGPKLCSVRMDSLQRRKIRKQGHEQQMSCWIRRFRKLRDNGLRTKGQGDRVVNPAPCHHHLLHLALILSGLRRRRQKQNWPSRGHPPWTIGILNATKAARVRSSGSSPRRTCSASRRG